MKKTKDTKKRAAKTARLADSPQPKASDEGIREAAKTSRDASGDAANADALELETKHYMYVLECADGTLYTGYTVDVEARVATHNAGKGAKYTAARRPVKLLAAATFQTKHDAMSAEYHFKQLSRSQKVELISAIETTHPFEAVLEKFFTSM